MKKAGARVHVPSASLTENIAGNGESCDSIYPQKIFGILPSRYLGYDGDAPRRS